MWEGGRQLLAFTILILPPRHLRLATTGGALVVLPELLRSVDKAATGVQSQDLKAPLFDFNLARQCLSQSTSSFGCKQPFVCGPAVEICWRWGGGGGGGWTLAAEVSLKGGPLGFELLQRILKIVLFK